MTIPAHSRAWLELATPDSRVTGDYVVRLDGKVSRLTGATFDIPVPTDDFDRGAIVVKVETIA